MARAAERLGSRTVAGLATAIVVAVAVLSRDWLSAVVATVAPVACFVLTEYVAKPLVNQPTPFGGRAYPSGHVAGVAAVALSALVLVYRRWGGLAAAAFAPVAVAAVVSVGLGVLGLGFHPYPTDVLGGVALGSTVVFTLTAVLSFATRPRG